MEGLKKRTHYSLSTDCVVFGIADGELKVALIQRKNAPFKGAWALPGGFLEGEETVEEGAFRELKEETGIFEIYLEQFHVFSHPKRDPRGRVITVAFFALVDSEQFKLIAAEDAEKTKWWPVNELPKLAFDHDEIFLKAWDALRNSFKVNALAFMLLPSKFTLTEVQVLYEKVFQVTYDKRNFRKKFVNEAYIIETGKKTKGGKHRPAMLYRFDKKRFLKGV